LDPDLIKKKEAYKKLEFLFDPKSFEKKGYQNEGNIELYEQ